MVILEWASTFVLALIATMAVNYAMFRRKRVGWYIALAFALYFLSAVFDLRPGNLPGILPPILFFLASLVMLWAVVGLILERPPVTKPEAPSGPVASSKPPSGPAGTKDT